VNGRANRRRGHDAERAVVTWLRAHGYPDAHTTRAALGHDGFRQPGDVVGPVGLVIEVKDRLQSSWPSWALQAAREADGRPWVVVRRLRGVPDVGQWLARWGGPQAGILGDGRGTLAGFLTLYDDQYSPDVA
jgi:hypothetical protein